MTPYYVAFWVTLPLALLVGVPFVVNVIRNKRLPIIWSTLAALSLPIAFVFIVIVGPRAPVTALAIATAAFFLAWIFSLTAARLKGRERAIPPS